VAVAAAVLLVSVVVWLADSLPRRWNLVLVVWQVPQGAAVGPTPRRDAVAAGGGRLPYAPDAAPSFDDMERWVAPLAAAGWTVVSRPPADAGVPGSVVEANLQALAAAQAPSPLRNVFLAPMASADRAELDREFGRLMDGLAGPLASSRTLYVVVDVSASEIHVGGPRNFDPDGLVAPEGDPGIWLADLMRVDVH